VILLGSVVAYYFQQRSVERTEKFARDQRLRSERLAIYSAFAAVLTAHRQAVVNVWLHRQEDSTGPEVRMAQLEATRVGATIDDAIYRVHLMTDDQELIALANRAHLPTLEIDDAANIEELRACEARSRDAIGSFILAAAAHVR
jgi:hypothetical protein